MPEDQQQPAPGPGGPDPAGPDGTRQFRPAVDPWGNAEPTGGPPADPAATTAMPRTPGRDATTPVPPDATARLPRSADSGPVPPDATSQLPRPGAGGPVPPDATSQLPRSGEPAPPSAGVWAGRAEVRPRGPVVAPGPPVSRWESGWESVENPTDRSWLRPVLLGIVALILLALLGVGLYLITRAGDRDGTPAVPVPTVGTTKRPATTAAPTSAAPTSARPTPSPTPDEPEDVVVPQLVGLTADEAGAELDELGLTYRQTFRVSDEPAGTVLETDPLPGRALPPGARVTLVVAAPARTTAGPPPGPSPSPSPTD